MTKKILLALVMCMFMISFASAAWEFDNIKDYDPETKTVTITNAFGLGEDIATIKLDSELSQLVFRGSDVKVAEFTIDSLDVYDNVWNDMDFYDVKDNNIQFEREFTYKMKNIYYEERDIVNYTCGKGTWDGIDFNPDCTLEVIGTEQVEKFNWVEIDKKIGLPKGKITIGIFTDVKLNEVVEWIPEWFGERIPEFATWNESMEVGLLTYYSFDHADDTTSNIVDAYRGIHNLTTANSDPTLVAGKINNGAYFDGDDGFEGIIDWGTEMMTNVTTMCLWVNFDSYVGADRTISHWDDDDASEDWLFYWNEAGAQDYLQLNAGTGARQVQTINPTTGVFELLCYRMEGVNAGQYDIFNDNVGGTGTSVNAHFSPDSFDSGVLAFGTSSTGTVGMTGYVDEIAIWNKTLTLDELTHYYNAGAGLEFRTLGDSTPNVTSLNSPANASKLTTSTVTLNWTAEDDSLISNSTLTFNGLANQTITHGTSNETTFQLVWSLKDGSYNWTANVTDNGSQSVAYTDTFFFSIDTLDPVVAITYPTASILGAIGSSVDINWTLTEANPDTCLWEYNNVNTSVTCTDLTDQFTSVAGIQNITFYVNDTYGNSATDFQAWTYSILENSQTYNKVTTEGASEPLSINVTISNGVRLSTAQLIYNGTAYSTSFVEIGDDTIISKTLTIPSVTAVSNFTFWWNLSLDDDSVFSSSQKNQTVENVGIDACGTNTILLYNFTMYDENTKTFLTNSTFNTTIEAEIEVYNLDRSTLVQNYSTSSGLNPFQICSATNFTNASYSVDGLIKYNASSYASEFYHIQNSTVDADSLPTNIALYDLTLARDTAFQITYKDESFLPVTNALIQVQRKYIADGVSRVVELPKTDANGETVAHLEQTDAIYTFVVVKNGVVLATFSNVIAVCQNIITQSCEINLNSFSSHTEPVDFTTSTDDFGYTIDYTASSREIEVVYTIPSGTPAAVLLNATLYDNIGSTQVCADSLTSSSGTLTCSVPISFGNGTVIAEVTKAGVLVGTSYMSMSEEPEDRYGGNLVFLGIFITLTLIGAGVSSNPMITGVFLIIGAILNLALNLVDSVSLFSAGATILWIIMAVILVLVKGAKRV